MTTIKTITIYNAPIEKVFNVNRDIDIHQQSATQTNEKAIAGTTSGLINKNETVTWKGKHFGVYITHQSIISEMIFPTYFIDEQLKGHFKSFKHQHFFEQKENHVEVTDIVEYETPFGIFGKIFDAILLKNYLQKFILQRNAFLKKLVEKS
ncbi:SRPBCC family protein [Flavobacterium urocaniciphilum]|uniref:Ligand-binding SRPBCC domain-containing protein n=1 Tax=Flavobacterium urocaniciphilum TaxID=1299341 RepID=A0A1H9C8K0_9FLAO|nr:SRPBCC family protein [Flavobacterium urocaniciphilum]SEP97516.1 Ligand-binding SRPBCC domain-containing protein [Flavobacterium urocaniciphilum]